MPTPTQNTKTNVSWLKPNQVNTLRDAAYQGRHGQRDETIITLIYDTGLRRNECSQLNKGMLDLDDNQLRIPPGIQKQYPNNNTPNPATFILDPENDLGTVRTLRAYLDNREDTSSALFPSQKSDRLTGKTINEIVKKAATRADTRPHTYEGRGGPSDVSAHTLRHSVAYRLLHEYDGYSLYDVRNRLRHASIVTTERQYDHFETI